MTETFIESLLALEAAGRLVTGVVRADPVAKAIARKTRRGGPAQNEADELFGEGGPADDAEPSGAVSAAA